MVPSSAGTCFWYCQADGRIFGQVNWKTWETKRKRRKETRKRKEKSWKSRKSKFNSSRAYHGKGCSPFRLHFTIIFTEFFIRLEQVLKLMPCWRILENSSNYFSEILVFGGGDSDQFMENSICLKGSWKKPKFGKF